ncbi:MAG: phosphatidylserine decarboxylase family protein [Gemmatimonadota bacterium]|nr:MAG: phosphatidylserine decarboxylase family protein [Gemmatimonadota bacterium]
MRFAREGRPFMLIAAAATAATVGMAVRSPTAAWAAVPVTALTFLVFYFFRDPERHIPEERGLVLAPGDGKVIEIVEVQEPSFFEGPCRRISIFLSIFNVHVQRAPASGSVEHRAYKPGSFAVAWHPKASDKNEQSSVGMVTDSGRLLVRQIAGLIARRIITYPEEGQTLERGQRIGLIRFGSRVDLFIPLEWPVECAVGDRAVGGTTVMARQPAVATDEGGP